LVLDYDGFGPLFWVFVAFFILLFAFLIVRIWWWTNRRRRWERRYAGRAMSGQDRAQMIARRRYARGEITREQYQQMQNDLGRSPPLPWGISPPPLALPRQIERVGAEDVPLATVVGDESSGRTTFLGLFYTSLVRFGGEQGDQFRLHASPASLALLSPLYEDVRAGSFPHWSPPGDPAEAVVSLGFKESAAHGLLSHLRHGGEGPAFRTLDLSLARIGPREVEGFVGSRGGLDRVGSTLTRTTELLLVLDASRLPSASGGASGPHPWDGPAAQLLKTLVSSAALHRTEVRQRLSPSLLWTKLDLLPATSLTLLGLSAAPGRTWQDETREATSTRVIARFLPQVSSVLASSSSAGSPVTFGRPLCFGSWVNPLPSSDGPGARLAGHDTATRGWEPEYPYSEYLSLIAHLRQGVWDLPGPPPRAGGKHLLPVPVDG
jgi:hypothetical protein